MSCGRPKTRWLSAFPATSKLRPTTSRRKPTTLRCGIARCGGRWTAIPAYYQTLFQADPLAGALETLALAAQIEDYLTEGRGRDLFGELQPIAVQTARKTRADVVDQLRLVARRQDGFDQLQVRIATWARENPIAGTSLASRPSLVPFLVKMAGPSDRDVFGAVGDIGGSVADIATRLDIYSAYLPRAARWQSELLRRRARRAGRNAGLAISTLQSMTRLMSRVEGLASPSRSIMPQRSGSPPSARSGSRR